MYKIVVFVPVDAAESVKQAMFQAGAGRQGAYENCCFQVEGAGQFRPMPGSSPTIGNQGNLEHVLEARIEMLCPPDKARGVVAALRAAHPYEEPAFDVVKLVKENELP